MKTEYKTCRCGQILMIYKVEYERDKNPQVIFFAGSSGNYEQVFICPSCQERLNYNNLGGADG